MTLLPTSKEDRAKAYLNVLHEINSRLKLIASVKSLDLPYGLAREICHLQLRHICELVAIGCVVAQGDYLSAPKLKGEYAPAKVFRHLAKYWSYFFPQAASVEIIDGHTHIACNQNPEAITQRELEKVWDKTGNFLHRLQISKFFREERSEDVDFWPELERCIYKIEQLLFIHAVTIERPKIMLLAYLRAENSNPKIRFLEYLEEGGLRLQDFTAAGETAFWHS